MTIWVKYVDLKLFLNNSYKPYVNDQIGDLSNCPICTAQDIFVNQLRILVSKKKLMELTITEGWYSEEELSSEIGWKK